MNLEQAIKNNIKKHLSRAALFTAYPFWMIVQNVSFFFTIAYFAQIKKLNVKIFKVDSFISFTSILLILGATASTIGAGINQGAELFLNSIIILPNYLYWGILMITLGNTALITLNLLDIYKVFFWGLILSIISYFFLGPFLSGIPIYRKVSPNNFSFILILFSPMATAYLHTWKKNNFYTLAFVLFVTIAGFMSGSRSGSILATAGCLISLSINSWLRIILTSFFTVFMAIATPQILESPAVKGAILKLNERTYELIYSTDETLATDRSYLTRLAMIEKGLNLFEKHPIEGVGVNNFTKVAGEFDFDFEGAEFVEGKAETLSEGISAHNSYISFLAEGGLLLFIPMILLISYPLFYFISHFNQIVAYEKAIFISILFMSIHSWFISGLLNVYAWFVIGIVNSYINSKKSNYVK